MNIKNRIPKIIHYCWFGGKELPDDLQKCVDSWKVLEGYEVKKWDESNCSFDENEFIKKAYREKEYAFISDFYRLKALYEYGGFYLDTDVMINRSFDDLLNNHVVLNFIFDCSVGSAIIGAEKNSKLIGEFLDMYYRTSFGKCPNGKKLAEVNGKIISDGFATNNYYFTYYILKHYPSFRLNNKYQDLDDFAIYTKEDFEIGKLNGKHHAIHMCAGEWREKPTESKNLKDLIKRIISKNDWAYRKVQIIVRKRRYKKMMKKIPFYPYYLAQKKKTSMPEL